MRLLMIGAPGAGKGTQAVRVAEHFGVTHISSGDLLRDHVRRETAIGRTVKKYIERGDLVPDAVVLDMLRKPVVAASEAGGYVLDGFPRTVAQAETAYGTAKGLGVSVQIACYLDVPHDDLIGRMLARSRGVEDTRDVIERRLKVYEEQTVPLIDYYRDRERLVTVNGAAPVEQVTWSLLVQIDRTRKAIEKANR
ncbi:MAG TPA: adenylate kinase [Frankiaceae bacterium]|nr:adenylate kinase [Frankiaceae bacterium]